MAGAFFDRDRSAARALITNIPRGGKPEGGVLGAGSQFIQNAELWSRYSLGGDIRRPCSL